MLAPNPSQHLESETTPFGNPLYDSAKLNRALGVLIDRERPRVSKEFRNNIETHIYALNHPKIGASAHQSQRGFASIIGMRKHIAGLIAFAHQVDPSYARLLYSNFNQIDWSR